MPNPEKFAPFPSLYPFSQLVAFRAKIGALKVVRILSTSLSQLRSESIILRAVLTPIHVLVGDEVRELINLRHSILIER